MFIEQRLQTAGYDTGAVRGVCDLISYTNRTLRITTDSQDYILKLFTEKSTEEVQQEIALSQQLRTAGIPVPDVIAAHDGTLVHEWNSKPFTVSEYCPGSHPEQTASVAQQTAYWQARMHTTPDLSVAPSRDWYRRIQSARQAVKTESFPGTETFRHFTNMTDVVHTAMQAELPTGIIHGDLFPDNVLFDAGKLVCIFDFDFSCTDTLLYDIGVGINGFCYPDNIRNDTLIANYVSGYEQVRPLTDQEGELLDTYIHVGTLSMISLHILSLSAQFDERRFARANTLQERLY